MQAHDRRESSFVGSQACDGRNSHPCFLLFYPRSAQSGSPGSRTGPASPTRTTACRRDRAAPPQMHGPCTHCRGALRLVGLVFVFGGRTSTASACNQPRWKSALQIYPNCGPTKAGRSLASRYAARCIHPPTQLAKLHAVPLRCRGPSRLAGWLESPPARGGL